LLAAGLARAGIASVRIDKRGQFGSRRAVDNPNAVTIADYAQDVRGWAAALKAKTDARCIWLLGHSEGGLVAGVAAPQSKSVCGVLLIAAFGRPFGDVLRQQLRANPANGPLLEDAQRILAALEGGRRVPAQAIPAPLYPLFSPSVQNFLMDVLRYKPTAVAASVDRPMLVLHGARDIQVTREDAQRLASANAQAQLRVLKGVNHVLKAVDDDTLEANIKTYQDPGLPLAEGVLDTLVTFIQQH